MKVDFAELMKENGYCYDTLAKKVGCSVGVLNKFFTKFYSEGEIIKFGIVLDIAELLLPEKAQDFMFYYCVSSDMPKHLKCALEYANTHTNVELLNELILTSESHKNKEMREFGSIYRLLHDRLIGKISDGDIQKKMNSMTLTSSSSEMKVLIGLVEMYFLYHRHNFKQIGSMTNQMEVDLDNIKDCYLKNSLTVKYNQMAAFVHLHVKNDHLTAREVSMNSINMNVADRVNGFFYNIIATTYFGESIDKMNLYGQKAIKAYSCISPVSSDLANRYMKLNMIMKEDYSLDYIKDSNDPLDLYIEGVNNDDTLKLVECLVELNKEGSKFFTGIVVDKLSEMGCPKTLIDSIQSIH